MTHDGGLVGSYVLVLPHKYWPGLDLLKNGEALHQPKDGSPACAAPPVIVLPTGEAFERDWEDDAHFLPYREAPFDPRCPAYRVNKESGYPALLASGHDVQVWLFVLEWDTGRGGEEHVPWTGEAWNAFHARLDAVRESSHPFAERLKSVAWEYSTRKGWRWIWRLKKGKSAPDAEPLIRGLAAEAISAGLNVDASSSVLTWGQPFRLPKVRRNYAPDGAPSDVRQTSSDDFFCLRSHPESTLDVETISPVGKPEATSSGASAAGPMPSQEEAKELIEFDGKLTPFSKAMKKALQGRDYFDFLTFNGGKYFESPLGGSRHDTLCAWALSLAGFVARYPDGTPAHIYALLILVAEQLAAEEPARPGGWLREVWRECTSGWTKASRSIAREVEQKQAEEVKKAEEARLEVAAELEGADRIIQGVRGWFPDLPLDAPAAWDWIRRHLILRERRKARYYLMRPDGRYASDPVDAGALVPEIIGRGMGQHIETWVETKAGPRPVRLDELHATYVSNVASVEYLPEIPGGYLVNPVSEQLKLVLLSFRRNPNLIPTFNADVDLWLRRFGGRNYEAICKHIGCFLAWERGHCAAMSFAKPPNSGKKILSRGLVECMEDPRHATGDDLVQQFNGKLYTTPFIFVNEGFAEKRLGGHHHASDTLRRAVTGDALQVERKGKDAENIEFSFRILLTANHMRLIDELGRGRDLSPDERDAIAQRLVHYSDETEEERQAAPRLFEEKGGERWTEGWIKGATPSQFIVAKHFLWLYEQHGRNAVPTGRGRLLIEGSVNQPAIKRLQVKGGSTPVVIEALVKLLNSEMLRIDGTGGVLVKDGRLYVTVSSIIDYWRQNLTRGTSERLTLEKVSLSLRGLLVGGSAAGTTPWRSIDGHAARWKEIDVEVLRAEAERWGWTCKRLDDLETSREETATRGAGSL